MANSCSLQIRIDGSSRRIKDFFRDKQRFDRSLHSLSLNFNDYDMFDVSELVFHPSEDGVIRSVTMDSWCKWSPVEDNIIALFEKHPELTVYIEYAESGNQVFGRITVDQNGLRDDYFTDDGTEYDDDVDDISIEELIFDANPNNDPIPENDGDVELSLFARCIQNGDIESAKKISRAETFDFNKKIDGWLPVQWAADRGELDYVRELLAKTTIKGADLSNLLNTCLEVGIEKEDVSFYVGLLDGADKDYKLYYLERALAAATLGADDHDMTFTLLDGYIDALKSGEALSHDELYSLNTKFFAHLILTGRDSASLLEQLTESERVEKSSHAAAIFIKSRDARALDLAVNSFSFDALNQDHSPIYYAVFEALKADASYAPDETIDYLFTKDNFKEIFKSVCAGDVVLTGYQGFSIYKEKVLHWVAEYERAKIASAASLHIQEKAQSAAASARRI